MTDYNWVTNEMFDIKLEELAKQEGVSFLLTIPGVYELVREELNNAVLAALQDDRDTAETTDESDARDATR